MEGKIRTPRLSGVRFEYEFGALGCRYACDKKKGGGIKTHWLSWWMRNNRMNKFLTFSLSVLRTQPVMLYSTAFFWVKYLVYSCEKWFPSFWDSWIVTGMKRLLGVSTKALLRRKRGVSEVDKLTLYLPMNEKGNLWARLANWIGINESFLAWGRYCYLTYSFRHSG